MYQLSTRISQTRETKSRFVRESRSVIHSLSQMTSQVKKKCAIRGIRWDSFRYEGHISSLVYLGVIWYYEELRISSCTKCTVE